MNLDELRSAITALDGELIDLVARRQALSEQVAAVKRATGKPTRDFGREREVILRARTAAGSRGVSPALAESILRQLIQSSLATQEQAGVAAQAHGSGKRALVIGGRGKMGHWFADFLASQGFRVRIADPAGALPEFDYVADWQNDALDQDLIVLATPLGATAELLQSLARRAPRGLIFDLGSLKTPLRSGLAALVAAGCRVTSLHPMFGPDTQLLSGRHVIFIDLGNPDALSEAQALADIRALAESAAAASATARVSATICPAVAALARRTTRPSRSTRGRAAPRIARQRIAAVPSSGSSKTSGWPGRAARRRRTWAIARAAMNSRVV